MGIWKKYPRVEFCAYGTGEDEKAYGNAEAAAREGEGGSVLMWEEYCQFQCCQIPIGDCNWLMQW